jgi:hypothetical protein
MRGISFSRRREKMLTYIITLVVVVIALLGAVGLHLLFGFHRATKKKVKVPRIGHTRNLHEYLFGRH